MRIWTKADEKFLKQQYLKLSYKEIGKILDRTEKSIKRKCNHLKLDKKPSYINNENYFKTWSHNMAYILGFITADGCLLSNRNTLAFCLHSQDIEILEFIKSEISPNRPIHFKIDKRFNTKFVSLRIDSKEIISDLKNLGLCERKTGKEVYPDVPTEFKFDYLRGLFDGDGCISIRNNKYKTPLWFICSSNKLFLETLQNKIYNIGYLVEKPKQNICYWNITKRSDIQNIREKLYNNSFSLSRKCEKMLTV